MKKLLQHPIILFVVLALGILIAVLLIKSRPSIQHNDKALEPRHVEVFTVQPQNFSAQITAYGNVEPAIILQSKAEVAGKVSYIHPELKSGGTLPADTVVIRIDPQDYEVSLEQTRADLSANRSSLQQLETEEASTRRSLKLAKENLRVGEKELQRVQSVWEKRLISRSAVDAEEQKVIQLRQQVEDLQGKLNSYSSRKASTQAQIKRAQQQVKGQTTTLGRTEIRIPFDARISTVEVEAGEFVPVGGTLFEALNTDGVEIEAELPMQQMQALVFALNGKELSFNASKAREILNSLQLRAEVRLVGLKNSDTVWQGRVTRFSEAVDPTTNTMGIVIAVDKPYENVIIGQRPPLLKGMYVAVDLYTPQREALVIPRKAIHQQRVYVVDAEQKLEIRPIKVQLLQNKHAVIAAGLEAGEQIIVNDLIPVIPGMPLALQQDAQLPLDTQVAEPTTSDTAGEK